MEVDTGASLSIISKQTFRAIASPTDKLQSTSITLTTYSGDNLHIMGTYDVQVDYKSQSQTLPLVVVKAIILRPQTIRTTFRGISANPSIGLSKNSTLGTHPCCISVHN